MNVFEMNNIRLDQMHQFVINDEKIISIKGENQKLKIHEFYIQFTFYLLLLTSWQFSTSITKCDLWNVERKFHVHMKIETLHIRKHY